MSGLPEIWRFEEQQWRMGKSLFEDKKAYEDNSPITYVDKIKTPVLIWTGEEDRQVHYHQSIAFYLALRRLKKEVIMMIYPGESHALLKKENQKDLTHRVEDWFGYYLKGESPKNWITEGI
jgi:dipeptidyl aminopeptidase/acylaminoacyl peptidase